MGTTSPCLQPSRLPQVYYQKGCESHLLWAWVIVMLHGCVARLLWPLLLFLLVDSGQWCTLLQTCSEMLCSCQCQACPCAGACPSLRKNNFQRNPNHACPCADPWACPLPSHLPPPHPYVTTPLSWGTPCWPNRSADRPARWRGCWCWRRRRRRRMVCAWLGPQCFTCN